MVGESPCFTNGLVARFCARTQAYAHGLQLFFTQLPRLLWIMYRGRWAPAVNRATEDDTQSPASASSTSEIPTVAQLRRRLLELRYLGKRSPVSLPTRLPPMLILIHSWPSTVGSGAKE